MASGATVSLHDISRLLQQYGHAYNVEDVQDDLSRVGVHVGNILSSLEDIYGEKFPEALQSMRIALQNDEITRSERLKNAQGVSNKEKHELGCPRPITLPLAWEIYSGFLFIVVS